MKTSLTMLHTRTFPWQGRVAIARAADDLGYSKLWVGESFGSDALSELAGYASSTTSIGLASGVVGIFGRTPATIAQSVATLDSISDGRFTLGLGTSSSVLATQWHGTSFEGALVRLRETIEVVRLIISGERLTYHGTVFDFSAGLRISEPPLRPTVPVYVGALAPGGLRLTGELADGWIATFVSPADYDRVLRRRLAEGFERRDESLGPLQVCVYQMIVPDQDPAQVMSTVRPHLARYIGLMGNPKNNYYARLFEDYGFPDEVARIQALYGEKKREAAELAVSDEMVERVTIFGSRDHCRERLEQLAALGVDEVALDLLLPGADLETYLRALEQLAPVEPEPPVS